MKSKTMEDAYETHLQLESEHGLGMIAGPI